jgi:uncharacterized protein VirK/YbjX
MRSGLVNSDFPLQKDGGINTTNWEISRLANKTGELSVVAGSEMDLSKRDLPQSLAESSTARLPELPEKQGSAWRILLASVRKLAKERYYWAPVRLPRIVWRMARQIPEQSRVLRVLSRPAYRQLMKVNPRFPLKYLGLDYLARGLTVKQQAESFIHHYRRLSDLLPEELLAQILLEDFLLDEIREGDDRFTVRMGLSRPWDDEGELSLNFEVNGELVFVLSFTIVPGWVVHSEAQEVILISRLQGVKGSYDEIRRATRAMCDVAPPALLFAALCGVAEAFGIQAMAGITAAMKPEFHFYEGEAAHIHQAYDGFFTELGAAKGLAGFYLAPMPPQEKPMTSIKQGHKIRTRNKRALKRQLARRIYLFLCDVLHPHNK